jgi:hypothetical protein
MRVWRRVPEIALVCLIFYPLSAFAAGPSDQASAERVLGPQWKHLARRAGMIFTGTVLSTGPRLTQTKAWSGAPSKLGLGGDFVEFHFRIDRSFAGVESGQILTIREWTGASSRQPAPRSGERFLLFLYLPSRLGLTSPVGGARGQIRLDSTGQSIADSALSARPNPESQHDQHSPASRDVSGKHKPIPVSQLERAIRTVRGESR